MAYNSKEWNPYEYRNQIIPCIKQHSTTAGKYLFDISLKSTRRKKIVTVTGSESEQYQKVISAYAAFRLEVFESYGKTPVTFEEGFVHWVSLKQPTRWTRQQRGVYKNHISDHLGAMNLTEIKAKDIDTVMIEVKGKAAATRKGVISIIKAVLTLALDEKIIQSLPIEKRHGVKVSALTQKTVILDAANIYRRVYRSIMEVFANDPKWRAIFLFGLNGRRKSEILSLEWDHISLDAGTYLIESRNSKIKQSLSFTIPADVLAALQEIRPDNPAGLVFPNPNTKREYTNIRTKVQMIRDHSSWSGYGFHRMRNLTASALFSAGVDAAYLSGILGHISPQTLQQYLTMERSKACKIVEDASQKILNQIGGNLSA